MLAVGENGSETWGSFLIALLRNIGRGAAPVFTQARLASPFTIGLDGIAIAVIEPVSVETVSIKAIIKPEANRVTIVSTKTPAAVIVPTAAVEAAAVAVERSGAMKSANGATVESARAATMEAAASEASAATVEASAAKTSATVSDCRRCYKHRQRTNNWKKPFHINILSKPEDG
jgi:hypothetical protein